MRGRVTVIIGLLAAFWVLPAYAQPGPPSVAAADAPPPPPASADDPTYTVTSLLSAVLGPLADATDPRMVEYAITSGVVNVVPRALENHPELGDPATLTDPAARARLAQDVVDGALHTRPTVMGSNIFFTGSPHFMPDWNRNGTFGDAGDYDIDNSPHPATAPFRYPCIGLDGTVSYETVAGTCVAGDSPGAVFRLGEVRKLAGVVNSRGLLLAAKLWLPHTALAAPPEQQFQGVVFADGNTSRQADYYAYHQNLARAGYVVMSFDEAGQGDSEGIILDEAIAPAVPGCGLPGACRDLQDAVRWFTGADITAVDTSNSVPRLVPRRNPAYEPVGNNERNPVLGLLDLSRIGITGQSMGSVATTSYLRYLPSGRDSDGRPLPPVAAAVAISGFVPGIPAAPVPVQAQTADYDAPGFGPLGEYGAADGPAGTKEWYDRLRGTGAGGGAVQMVVFEGGLHLDQSNVPFVPRSPWTLGLSTAYQLDWFDCYLRGDAGACGDAVAPRPHLSRATASEYDPDGPAGPAPSYCTTIPDAAAIGDPASFGNLFGMPAYDCQPAGGR